MIVLAIDTCLGACSAAIIRDDAVLADRSEPMWRGHQERLASLVRETATAAGVGFADLERVGATVGPGSFTGLRVGVAFAKGLSLALSIPAVGVGTLQALAFGRHGRIIAAADARRDNVYWQAFADGVPVTAPSIDAIGAVPTLSWEGAPTGGAASSTLLIGPGASLLAPHFPGSTVEPVDAPRPADVARLAARAGLTTIKPLYLRPPDAKLPGGVDPVA